MVESGKAFVVLVPLALCAGGAMAQTAANTSQMDRVGAAARSLVGDQWATPEERQYALSILKAECMPSKIARTVNECRKRLVTR